MAADFGEVFTVHRPDADGLRVGAGLDAQLGEGCDDDGFQPMDISTDRQTMLRETDDWIRHDLAGAVIGDVAAAVAADQIDIQLGQFFRTGDQVPDGFLAPAEGDYGAMFDEEYCFGSPGEDLSVARVPAAPTHRGMPCGQDHSPLLV